MKKKKIANHFVLSLIAASSMLCTIPYTAICSDDRINTPASLKYDNHDNTFHTNLSVLKRYKNWITLSEKNPNGKLRYHAISYAVAKNAEELMFNDTKDAATPDEPAANYEPYVMLTYIDQNNFTLSYYPKKWLLRQEIDVKNPNVILQIKEKSYRLKACDDHAETHSNVADTEIVNSLMLSSRSDFLIYSTNRYNKITVDKFSSNGALEAMQYLKSIGD